jgi:hypothetical protein
LFDVSKLVKKATAKGKQAEVAPPKKAKATSKGKGVSTAPPEDKEKASMSRLQGKRTAKKDNAEMKIVNGMLVLQCYGSHTWLI